VTLNVTEGLNALSASTQAGVTSAAVVEGAGTALCAAFAAALREQVNFPAVAGSTSPSVRCAKAQPFGDRVIVNAGFGDSARRVQADAAAPPTRCDPLAYSDSAAGCVLAGYDMDMAVTDAVLAEVAAAALAAYVTAVTEAMADLPAAKAAAAVRLAAASVESGLASTGAGDGDGLNHMAAAVASVSAELLSVGTVTATAPSTPGAAASAIGGPQPAAASSGGLAQGPVIGIAVGLGALAAVAVAAAFVVLRRRGAAVTGGAAHQGIARSGQAQRSVRGATNPLSRSAQAAAMGKTAVSPQQDLEHDLDLTVVTNPLPVLRGGPAAPSAIALPDAYEPVADFYASQNSASRGRWDRVTSMSDRHAAAPVGVRLVAGDQTRVQLPGASGL
jgi:hypothetical protein